jgi:hypothetical protein
MRTIILVACSFVFAANAAGRPTNLKHVLTAVPRAVGRSAENMVTFKDRNLALHQWLLFAALMANAGSEVNLYSRCQNCHELNTIIYGLHPSAGRLIGEEFIGAMFFATIQQESWELSYEQRSAGRRILERWAPTILPVMTYSVVTYRNTTIPSDGSRVISFWQFP